MTDRQWKVRCRGDHRNWIWDGQMMNEYGSGYWVVREMHHVRKRASRSAPKRSEG